MLDVHCHLYSLDIHFWHFQRANIGPKQVLSSQPGVSGAINPEQDGHIRS